MILKCFPPSPWQRNEQLSILSEVSRKPRGAEWLWHPTMVVLYKLVLQSSNSNSTCREAAIGALQNITAGEARVRFHTQKKNQIEWFIYLGHENSAQTNKHELV